MGTVIIQFPDAFIELGREIHNHSDLMEILNSQEIKEFEVFFGQIAAYCNVAMDDVYTQDDLIRIAEILIQRLKAKRVVLILPDADGSFTIH